MARHTHVIAIPDYRAISFPVAWVFSVFVGYVAYAVPWYLGRAMDGGFFPHLLALFTFGMLVAKSAKWRVPPLRSGLGFVLGLAITYPFLGAFGGGVWGRSAVEWDSVWFLGAGAIWGLAWGTVTMLGKPLEGGVSLIGFAAALAASLVVADLLLSGAGHGIKDEVFFLQFGLFASLAFGLVLDFMRRPLRQEAADG